MLCIFSYRRRRVSANKFRRWGFVRRLSVTRRFPPTTRRSSDCCTPSASGSSAFFETPNSRTYLWRSASSCTSGKCEGFQRVSHSSTSFCISLCRRHSESRIKLVSSSVSCCFLSSSSISCSIVVLRKRCSAKRCSDPSLSRSILCYSRSVRLVAWVSASAFELRLVLLWCHFSDLKMTSMDVDPSLSERGPN
jgi:hypothetical protein